MSTPRERRTNQIHPEHCNDESNNAEPGANINSMRVSVPETGKERTVIIVLFLLLMLCLAIIVTDVVRNTRRDEIQNQVIKSSAEKIVQADAALEKAKTDLKTQVWLRSDSLTKENAELRGHVLAIEIVLKSRGISLPPVKPLTVLPAPLPQEYQ